MGVDQEWVRENIDRMVAVFLKINPRFQDHKQYHKLRTECEKVERLKAGYEAARGRIVAEFGEKSHEYAVFSGAFSLSPSSHSPPASRLNAPSSPRPSPSLA